MKRIAIIGIGPGNPEGMTIRARNAVESCQVVVGYHVYVEQVRTMISDKTVIENGMGQEKERCEKAITLAAEGNYVAMVCSGDSGLYGMAGLIYELLDREQLLDHIEVEVIPGVTSALSCASLLGAPIVEDFCTISLSDYMTDKDKIHRRLELASKADFTMAIYNPRSSKRPEYLKEAIEILLNDRESKTPVGIVRNAYREDQTVIRTTLDSVPYNEVDMFCTLIIGNSRTKWIDDFMVTSRGYAL